MRNWCCLPRSILGTGTLLPELECDVCIQIKSPLRKERWQSSEAENMVTKKKKQLCVGISAVQSCFPCRHYNYLLASSEPKCPQGRRQWDSEEVQQHPSRGLSYNSCTEMQKCITTCVAWSFPAEKPFPSLCKIHIYVCGCVCVSMYMSVCVYIYIIGYIYISKSILPTEMSVDNSD